jgi:hypothetical protein
MNKKKVYIAGKVTGEPPHTTALKFAMAKKEIEAMGFEAINPIEVVGDFKAPWQYAMKKCIKAMLDCDGVVILPCWILSPGAKIERQLAEDLDIVICNSDSFGLKVLKAHLS